MPRIKFPVLKKFFILFNIAIIFCYLLACLVPFVNTEILWFIALLGLVFPIIFFVLCSFVIFWLIFRSRWWLISFVTLLFGFKQITSTFSVHGSHEFSLAKEPNTLRVLHWNVSDWNYSQGRGGGLLLDEMLELIKEQNADLLCFQEFYEPSKKNASKSVLKFFQTMGYPYYYFIPSTYYGDGRQSGIGIFSRFALLNTVNFPFTDRPKGEHLLQADVKVNGQMIRIMTTHLQSVRLDNEDLQNISQIKTGKNKRLAGSRTLVSKLKRGYELRYEQAVLVSSKIKESPYPVILTGDFNDVPSSSTYFKIKGNLQDVFLRKGSFIGRTYRYISPTLRIDYILADRVFKVTQFKRLKGDYSDHYGLVTDLQFTVPQEKKQNP